MATVNVYTYYTHKLAYERDQRRQVKASRARRRSFSLPRIQPGLLFWGALLGSSAELAQPGLGYAGAVVGGLLGWAVETAYRRTRKVLRILQGKPLEVDDLRALSGRR